MLIFASFFYPSSFSSLINIYKKKYTKLITGNGRPDATLSASGVDARGEANSEELFLPKLNEKGDLGNTPGLVDDVVVVFALVVYFKYIKKKY